MVSQYPTPDWIQEPAAPQGPYTQEKALEDLPGIAYALHLFLASHMIECEEYCNRTDPTKCVLRICAQVLRLTHSVPHRERLYFATGYGLIQVVKGLMSFEDEVSSLRLDGVRVVSCPS